MRAVPAKGTNRGAKPSSAVATVLADGENGFMHTRDRYLAQDQLSPQQGEAAQAAPDHRWPGAFMVLLILLALVWPIGTLAAGLVAYLMADREQANVLFGVGAGFLLLRWMLGG